MNPSDLTVVAVLLTVVVLLLAARQQIFLHALRQTVDVQGEIISKYNTHLHLESQQRQTLAGDIHVLRCQVADLYMLQETQTEGFQGMHVMPAYTDLPDMPECWRQAS